MVLFGTVRDADLFLVLRALSGMALNALFRSISVQLVLSGMDFLA